jgi:hypothetical protein
MLVILATWEAEIQRIAIQGQPRQKVWETPSQPKNARHGGIRLSSQQLRNWVGSIELNWRIIVQDTSKITRVIRTVCMAQVAPPVPPKQTNKAYFPHIFSRRILDTKWIPDEPFSALLRQDHMAWIKVCLSLTWPVDLNSLLLGLIYQTTQPWHF